MKLKRSLLLCKTLNIFTDMQHDKDVDRRVMARALIHVLIERQKILRNVQTKIRDR